MIEISATDFIRFMIKKSGLAVVNKKHKIPIISCLPEELLVCQFGLRPKDLVTTSEQVTNMGSLIAG